MIASLERTHARRGVRWLAVAMAAFATILWCATSSAASIERLREFVRDTRTARMAFTQVVTDKTGRTVQKASGEFLISRPGRFRWSLEKPYRQLVVGDGERVWIYDEDLNQVVVRRSGEALGSTPAALLAGREDVEAAFEWKSLPPSQGLDWLAATPRSAESGFSEIRLGFDAKRLVALELVDAFGQKTVVQFDDVQRNPSLPADAFRFTPPKGADVIGEATEAKPVR